MRVLIADDQRSFATALAEMVRHCGHEVVAIVGSGLDAIHAYTLHKPDLVLMDHRMPKLNGVTASRHILAKYPAARVVMLSAWSPLDGADESGAMCFLPKPVDLARLSATLLTVSHSMPPPADFDLPSPISNLPSPISDLPSSISDLPSPNSDLPSPTPCAFIPIPQEMISPVETFPIDIFPIELNSASGDVDQNKIVQLPVNPKAQRKRRRNGRRRAPYN